MPRAGPESGSAALACAALLLGACGGAPVAPPSTAAIDALATVNDTRSRGCGATIAHALRADPALDVVAARLPDGASLEEAIAAEHYPAARSASIRVSRAADAAALSDVLSRRFCSDVADPEFRILGQARRGEDLWIVLAAPFYPPAGDTTAVARRALALVNDARSKPRHCGSALHAAAGPVVLDSTLISVADGHARDMARHGRMSHDGSDGSTPAERVTRAGYAWSLVAENVAAGDTTADGVVLTWLASPGHCANLMNPTMREMGIASAFEPSSPKGTYWVQLFATRR